MSVENNQKIAINFLPLTKQNFSLDVFVKKAEEQGKKTSHENIKTYKLPSDLNDMSGDYINFQVSAIQQPDFIPVTLKSETNRLLTLNKMFWSTIEKCKGSFGDGQFIVEDGFRKYIRIKISTSKEGNEEIRLEPYHLDITNEYGYLLEFHFSLAENQQLNKIVLQKSLSLNADGRENINYYADHHKKLRLFIVNYVPHLFPLKVGSEIAVETNFKELEAKRLESKKYIFKNDKVDISQFQGIKKNGPLEAIDPPSLICFMYRAADKNLSYELYYALKGKKYVTFTGMEDMFSFALSKEHVTGISLPDYAEKSIAAAIGQMKEMANGRRVLPLLIVPWSRLEHDDEGDRNYFRIKHQFLSEGMPTQFVSLQRMRGRDSLKWSISNIGLAVFSKLGGIPWKLQPTHDKCLIIGIGQAHRRKEEGGISRYYAYSVLSDSSGLYDSIKVLSKSEEKDLYLSGLTDNIKKVILDKASKYERFVIHTTFKLRIEEIKAITKGLEEVSNNTKKDIVVLKFNDNGRYFGFSLTSNSKVPFESSCVPLGGRQYLVWFEGLQYHNPTVHRRIAKPMHIEFIYSSNKTLTKQEEISFLQDAINISGANWRGFNAKSSPISVYYAKIIADYIGNFDKYGLPEIDIENLVPWFL